jgi:hypothetical protein
MYLFKLFLLFFFVLFPHDGMMTNLLFRSFAA